MKRVVIVCLFIALIFGNGACAWFKPSPRKMQRLALEAHPQYDAVIIPGVQFYEPVWNQVMQVRLIWAKHLYDKGIVKNFITSGAAVYTPYVEAQIWAEYLVQMGIPRERIFMETKAEHSTENVWYGYKLAKQQGFKSVALCTDPYQAKMLWRFVKKRMNKEVKFLPAIFDTLRTLPHDTPVVDFKKFKVENFTPITQGQSTWYRFRGTMGKNINYKE